jgi:hypothetical protein
MGSAARRRALVGAAALAHVIFATTSSARRDLRRRGVQLSVAILVLAIVCATGSTAAGSSASAWPLNWRLALAGTLTLKAELVVTYPPADCPAGTPNSLECFARTGRGPIRGLGSVSESYPYFVESSSAGCAADQVRVLPATVRFGVADKGEIELHLGGSGCLDRVPPNPVRGAETFTVTGGSGRYAGASGGGTITHESNGPPAWRGRDTWTGTLTVPGLDFDVTPPRLTGAANKTVRAKKGAKSSRVTFRVTARDDRDGQLPVTCAPKSGSRFKAGRTRVTCEATDSSANTARSTFVVAVRMAQWR